MSKRVAATGRRLRGWLVKEIIWVTLLLEWMLLLALLWFFWNYFWVNPSSDTLVIFFLGFFVLGFVLQWPFHRIAQHTKASFVRYFLKKSAEGISGRWGVGLGVLLAVGSPFLILLGSPMQLGVLVFGSGVGMALLSWSIAFDFGDPDPTVQEPLVSSLEFIKGALRVSHGGTLKPYGQSDSAESDGFVAGFSQFCRNTLFAVSELSSGYAHQHLFDFDEPDFEERFTQLAYVHGFGNARRQWEALQVIDRLIRFVREDDCRAFAETLLFLPRELGINQADWFDVRRIMLREPATPEKGLSTTRAVLVGGVASLLIFAIAWLALPYGLAGQLSYLGYLWLYNLLELILLTTSWVIVLLYPYFWISRGKQELKYLEVAESQAGAVLENLPKEEDEGQSIKRLIEAGESETVEFKSGVQEELQDTLVAFANTRGGTVLVGVADDTHIKGVTDIKGAKDAIQNKASSCVPPVSIKSSDCKVKGRPVIVIDVPESPLLHRWKKDIYVRRSATTRVAQESEVEWIIQRRSRPFQTYESLG